MAYIYSLLRHGIYPYRHARAILMCLTLLNSFNHMKSFTMFIFSWLKFVKKRGTSIYLWGYMSCLLLCVFIAIFRLGTVWNYRFFMEVAELSKIDNIDKPWWFDNSRRGMTLLRRETPAFAQQKWPRWLSLSLRPLWIGSATRGICALV